MTRMVKYEIKKGSSQSHDPLPYSSHIVQNAETGKMDTKLTILFTDDLDSVKNAHKALSSIVNGGNLNSWGVQEGFKIIKSIGGTNQFSSLCFNWFNKQPEINSRKYKDPRNSESAESIARITLGQKNGKFAYDADKFKFNDRELNNLRFANDHELDDFKTVFSFFGMNNLPKISGLKSELQDIRKNAFNVLMDRDHNTLQKNLSNACDNWMTELSSQSPTSDKKFNKSIKLSQSYVKKRNEL